MYSIAVVGSSVVGAVVGLSVVGECVGDCVVGAGVGAGVGATWEQNLVVSNANWRSSLPLLWWEIQSPKKSTSARLLFKAPSIEFCQDDCPERWPLPSMFPTMQD
jgi:hypothetical protein